MARKLHYRWERTSSSSIVDYLDERAISWTTVPVQPGNYVEFLDNGYYYDNNVKYEYKVEGDRIMRVMAGNDRYTTPQFKDTIVVREVNDHLLVLYKQYYFVAGAYRHLNKFIDSLKK